MGGELGSARQTLSLPASPSSAGVARTLTDELLTAHRRRDLVESARLLVSELVTNSVMHAGTPLDVELALSPEGLWVQVSDGSPHLPTPRHYDAAARTGRGLGLVRELATAWGAEATPAGKAVWFRLGGSHDSTDTAAANGPSTRSAVGDGGATVTVKLLNVPLLLCQAWQQNTEALLREYLMTHLDRPGHTDPVRDPIQLHAAATEAITVVAEHIPALASWSSTEDVKQTATEPGASLSCVDLDVPVAVVARFQTLRALLEAAATEADTGRSPAPPVQPELRGLTDWLCGQVHDQANGAAPTPWSLQELPPPPPSRVLAWNASAVTHAVSAQVAGDDTGRIVAVSDRAVELLGYHTRSQLVGRRVLVLIPPRYRQAHLAGFTFYLLDERSGPVVRSGVTAPALRADGGEVSVRITVEPQKVVGGRTVFIATLTARDRDES